MDMRKIEEGDFVRVNCNNAQCTLIHKGIVKYLPCQTGDSWIILDTRYDPYRPVYISEGVEIILLQKKDGTQYRLVQDDNLPF